MADIERAERPPVVLLAEEVWGSTLHAMRSLDAVGAPVLVATAGEGSSVYRRSRHCDAATDLRSTDPPGLCAELRSWVESRYPDDSCAVVVLPLSDRLLEVLHRERASFGPRYRLAAPRPEVTEALLDKVSSLVIAEAAGLTVPRWTAIEADDDLERLDGIPLPAIIRPTSWSTTGSEYFKVAVARDRRELVELTRSALGRGARLIVQEYLDTTDDAVELGIVWRSATTSLTAVCTGRKRRQSSPEGGVMAWGEAVPLPDVAAAAEAFLDESGFTGPGGIELVRTGGQLHFIEFNPRLEAIHFLAAAAGVDTVLMAYEELALGTVPPWVPTQRPAAAWLGTAWLERVRTDRSAWRVAIRDRREFQRRPNRVRAIWSPTDPGPASVVTARIVGRGFGALTGRSR